MGLIFGGGGVFYGGEFTICGALGVRLQTGEGTERVSIRIESSSRFAFLKTWFVSSL